MGPGLLRKKAIPDETIKSHKLNYPEIIPTRRKINCKLINVYCPDNLPKHILNVLINAIMVTAFQRIPGLPGHPDYIDNAYEPHP